VLLEGDDPLHSEWHVQFVGMAHLSQLLTEVRAVADVHEYVLRQVGRDADRQRVAQPGDRGVVGRPIEVEHGDASSKRCVRYFPLYLFARFIEQCDLPRDHAHRLALEQQKQDSAREHDIQRNADLLQASPLILARPAVVVREQHDTREQQQQCDERQVGPVRRDAVPLDKVDKLDKTPGQPGVYGQDVGHTTLDHLTAEAAHRRSIITICDSSQEL
jgi:hypothetical protein